MKYIWLLDTLLSSDCPLTFEEIWLLWGMNHMDDSPLSIRTFHEHRKGIKEMFGVDIECDRSRNVYYVKNPEVLDENKLAQWLLRKYSIPQDFATFNSMKDRVLLEEIPLGTAFLNSIIDAMHKNVELQVDYQRYENEQEEHLQELHIQPYALKVFNRRWYLLGYIKEKSALHTIALDRILHLEVLTTSFTLPENFDAKKHFANVVGIFVNKDLPVTNVKIRTYGVQTEYLRSTPLHKSQSEGRSKHREFAEFTYRICITPELISQLLAMGDKVEVLEPQELREEMRKRISKCLIFINRNSMESIIAHQKTWIKEQNKHCSYDYLDNYQDNLFMTLDGEDLDSFKNGSGNELEDKNGEKAKMKALISSSALCVNFFLYLKQKGLLTSFLELIGIHNVSVLKGEFEKKLKTGASPAKANLDFFIDCSNCVIGIESKFTEHYDKNHGPLKQSYLEKKNNWQLKEKFSNTFCNLAKWINCNWTLGEYSDKKTGKTYKGRFSPFKYLDVAQLIKHLFALDNDVDVKKPYILLYIHYDILCNEIKEHEDEIGKFRSILKKDNVYFISVSYQSIFDKLSKYLKKDVKGHEDYLTYMKSRYLL